METRIEGLNSDRRTHVSWTEAVQRVERVIVDTVDDLNKVEGGDIYAEELLACWRKVLEG
jgi:hypothetical protein|tara:strand:+ start:432 stop:611 length:180 start_codon:yes stop_codon:yes gene_type:complete